MLCVCVRSTREKICSKIAMVSYFRTPTRGRCVGRFVGDVTIVG